MTPLSQSCRFSGGKINAGFAWRRSRARACRMRMSPRRGVGALSQGGGRLLKRLRSLAGAFGARFGWNWIGFALGLGIVGISLYVLSHLLQDIEPSRVLAAARATPPRSIASAIFFIACAYGTL